MKSIYGIGLFCTFLCSHFMWSTTIKLTVTDAHTIGEKIWYNEGAKQIDKLTWWNEGENFASLGIGHFIWYPKDVPKKFSESFPELIHFIASTGKQVPSFLRKKNLYCPWSTREDFFKNFESAQMVELRSFLANTVDLQTQFIVQRLKRTLPGILKYVPHEQSTHAHQQFNRVASSKAGLYALIDYVNFKGEGTNQKEKYNGYGWGLLHVLLEMKGKKAAKMP